MTELAEQDLENIGDYIAYTLLNPQAAAATVSGIRSKANALCDFPERNELSRDMVLAQIGVRIEHYRNYNIHYVISGRERVIFIVRILHMLEDNQRQLYQTFELS